MCIRDSNFRSPQTGQVDREQLNQFQEAINNGQELAPQFVNFWNEQRKQVIKTSIQSKLTNMVSKAMVVPTWMAELSAKSQSEKVDFDYVMVPVSYTHLINYLTHLKNIFPISEILAQNSKFAIYQCRFTRPC